MSSVNVEVEVDLSEIDTDDLMKELGNRNGITKNPEFKKWIEQLAGKAPIKLITLDDEMKFKTFKENFDKFTDATLNEFIKNLR